MELHPMKTQEEALQYLRDSGIVMEYDVLKGAYQLKDLYPVLKLLQKLIGEKEPVKYCKNCDDRIPEAPPDGGRAFPFSAEYGHPAACGGMSLRHYFAAAALSHPYTQVEDAHQNADKASAWAFELADAMLKKGGWA